MTAQPMSENAVQRAVCDHLHSRGVPGLVWFAVPNGGYRTPAEAAILKGQGVQRGVSDLILLHAGKFYALELKRDGQAVKLGSPQDEFINQVRAQGGTAGWAAGLDAALRVLEEWNLLLGKAA